MQEQIAAETRLVTDDARQYSVLGKDFAEHHVVNHSIGEYVLVIEIAIGVVIGLIVFKWLAKTYRDLENKMALIQRGGL